MIPDPNHATVSNKDLFNESLLHLEIRLPLENTLHETPVTSLIVLRSCSLNCRPLFHIQRARLYGREIGDLGHFAAQNIHLLDKMPLSQSSNGGRTRHVCHSVEVDGENQRLAAHPSGGQCGLATRMTGSDNDDIISI